MKKVLFTGGGSAGHVVPNLALIEELLSQGDVEVGYMGSDGIEKRLVAPYKIPFYTINPPKLVRGMSLTNIKENAKIPLKFYRAKQQAIEGLNAFRPDVVFSKGGFVALPVIFAAKKLKIPCFAHESDFSLGLSNRLSAKKCKTLFTTFPETAKHLPNGECSGAILRKNLFTPSRNEARAHFNVATKEKVLLVFGGGSGSAKINEAVRSHIRELTERYVILHVCGKGNVVNCNINRYRQFEFIKDMGMAYACADLVVCRAGANTVFEILALKKPTLFVPLQNASRGDQLQNADYFFKKGLCHLLGEDHLSALPLAVALLENDKELPLRLKESLFPAGNDLILQKIRKYLS